MNKDWFEQALREKYPSEAHNFDTDTAWTALAKRRHKKRRRLAYWWFATTGIMVLCAAFLFWPKEAPPSDCLQGKFPGASVIAKQRPVARNTETRIAGHPKNNSKPQEKGLMEPKAVSPDKRHFNGKGRTEFVATKAENIFEFDKNTQPPQPALTREPAVKDISQETYLPGEATSAAANSPVQQSLLRLETKVPVVRSASKPEIEPPAAFVVGEKKKTKSSMARWWVGASAYYGLASVYRAGDFEDYYQVRASEETALDMFQAGLECRYYLKPIVFLQTGLLYTQWTDVRERTYQESYTVRDSNYLIGQLIRANGTVQNIYGPVDIAHIRKVTSETYNRYSHLELPVLAGISLPAGGQWRFECAAGPVLGLLSTRSGSILDGNNSGQNLPLQDAPYRNSGTISGMLRLELVYARKGWSAGIGTMGRFSLNDWAQTGHPFSEKRYAVGAGLVFRKAIK